jgi:glycosylphosphatidylinositol phospholipase D
LCAAPGARAWVVLAAGGAGPGSSLAHLVPALWRAGLGTLELGAAAEGIGPEARSERLVAALRLLREQRGGDAALGLVGWGGEAVPALSAAAARVVTVGAVVAAPQRYAALAEVGLAAVDGALQLLATADETAAARRLLGALATRGDVAVVAGRSGAWTGRGERQACGLAAAWLAMTLAMPGERRTGTWLAPGWLAAKMLAVRRLAERRPVAWLAGRGLAATPLLVAGLAALATLLAPPTAAGSSSPAGGSLAEAARRAALVRRDGAGGRPTVAPRAVLPAARRQAVGPKALLPGTIELSALSGPNGFRLNGISSHDRSGFAVSGAGDVNGDGFDDLLIGAYNVYRRFRPRSGQSYVVYGGSALPGTVELAALSGSNGFRLDGISREDRSGLAVSGAGDVNGDGFDDLLIGADWADPNGSRSGQSYLVYGGSAQPGRIELSALAGSNGFRLNGVSRDDYSGRVVSGAGDVNGDGFDDLLIGASAADPNGSRSGQSYVVYGGSALPGTIELSALAGPNGFRLNGISSDHRSGYAVSGAGDVNGDGFDDLLIGACCANPNGLGSGQSYVVYGGSALPGTVELSALSGSAGFRLNGISGSDSAGSAVSGAGDVNGDGFDDLLIGAPNADPNGYAGGQSYVVYGGSALPGTIELSALAGSNGFRLNGISSFDRAGSAVSAAGDVDGDGFDDLLIGAFRADPNGHYSGQSYLVYGGSALPGTVELSALSGSNGFRLNGVATDDFSGSAVSAAGDVDGDGFDDLLIGASGAGPNGLRSGQSYVVYGGGDADLAITKTDGVTTTTPGGTVTYTIVVTNAGPSNAPGSTVTDTFPAACSSVSYTSVAAGGATGNTNGPAAGNIADIVDLPVGSSVTYTATCTISPAATGTLDNTATVAATGGATDPDPGNNSATDSDTLAPQADLTITKTDGVTTATAGGSVTYTITVANAGPSDAPGSTVTDTFPAACSSVSYTSVAAGGATGNTPGPAAGNIADTVNLPAGSSVTYACTCTISPAATGTLTNTATVIAAPGVTDPDPNNSAATDSDTLVGGVVAAIPTLRGWALALLASLLAALGLKRLRS